MSTGSRWANADSAARSLRPRRARQRSSAARRPASSSSASTWQNAPRYAKASCSEPRRLVRDEPHPSCVPFGHAPGHLPTPRPNCFKANSFTHKFCGKAEKACCCDCAVFRRCAVYASSRELWAEEYTDLDPRGGFDYSGSAGGLGARKQIFFRKRAASPRVRTRVFTRRGAGSILTL